MNAEGTRRLVKKTAAIENLHNTKNLKIISKFYRLYAPTNKDLPNLASETAQLGLLLKTAKKTGSNERKLITRLSYK